MNDGGRPASAGPAEVTLSLQVGVSADQPPSIDRPLGSVLVEGPFKPYRFQIPAELAGTAAAGGKPVRFKLTTTVWSPQTALGTSDDRQVGVMVDRVAVQ
jgi:hypothetical protein